MTEDSLVAKSDKMFHHHGDILIKVFSVLVALLLLGLWFISTSQSPFSAEANPANEEQRAER